MSLASPVLYDWEAEGWFPEYSSSHECLTCHRFQMHCICDPDDPKPMAMVMDAEYNPYHECAECRKPWYVRGHNEPWPEITQEIADMFGIKTYQCEKCSDCGWTGEFSLGDAHGDGYINTLAPCDCQAGKDWMDEYKATSKATESELVV